MCEVVAGGDGTAFGGRPSEGHMMDGLQSRHKYSRDNRGLHKLVDGSGALAEATVC